MKSEILNNYFSSITNLSDSRVDLPQFEERCTTELSHITVTELEVVDAISTLDANKAVGPDIISNKMLIASTHEVSKPLCMLFNKSLADKCFPIDWKLAHVIPLFKNGDKSLPSNYRPVSLLSCTSKLFEKIIFKHIFNHLISNKLLYKFQSGFIPGFSTTHQLIELYHEILCALEKKQKASMTYADISKAFDTVWIKGLLLKLERYGIKGNLLTWLNSYLTNRSQKVILKEALSDTRELKAGVPQGSVLGPLLFLIFINDIADGTVGLGRLFADDTSIGHVASNYNTLENIINLDLNYLNEWSKKWLVKFNPNKTDIMVFSLTNVESNLEFDFDETILKPVNIHKHLGIIFSSDCKWTNHIDKMIGKASKQLNVLRKLKYKLKREYLEKMYLTFIRPILEYSSEVWDNCGKVNSERLEKLQTEAARIVTGLTSYASLESIYKESGWETLKTRRLVRKLSLFYKIVNEQTPQYLTDLVPDMVSQNNNYDLRNSQDLSQSLIRLSAYQNSFFPSTVKLWNSLDLQLRQLPTFSLFKKKLREVYYQNAKVPTYFTCGDPYLNILHCRLRNKCSALNGDLFHVNLVDNPACSCGYDIENANHFLLSCSKYNMHRDAMIAELKMLQLDDSLLNVDLLLFGNDLLNYESNIHIFLHVQRYIKNTGRFCK
ncbi:hypothetical protein SNE40_011134 [Patella caerulea]